MVMVEMPVAPDVGVSVSLPLVMVAVTTPGLELPRIVKARGTPCCKRTAFLTNEKFSCLALVGKAAPVLPAKGISLRAGLVADWLTTGNAE